MGGRRILLEGPRFVFEVLLGPGEQGSRQPFMYRSEFNFTPVGTKRSGDLPLAVTAAHTITDCGFWRQVSILPSVVDEDAQTLSFFWLTACWMSNFSSSVKTKLGSVPSVMSCKSFLHFSALMAT